MKTSPNFLVRHKGSPRGQRGAALIMAVFVLTVMLLLGSVLVRTLNQENYNVGIETTNTRAWAAAQSGVDYYLAKTLGRDIATTGSASCPGSTTTLTPGSGLPAINAFDRCTVNISCVYGSANASDEATNRYKITASATCGPDQLQATRTVEALAYD